MEAGRSEFELIQCRYFGDKLKNSSVFSINSNEMLSKAFGKCICIIRPGRLLSLAFLPGVNDVVKYGF